MDCTLTNKLRDSEIYAFKLLTLFAIIQFIAKIDNKIYDHICF